MSQEILCSVQLREKLGIHYPMLLLDRVSLDKETRQAAGLKNLSVNEPFFQGHFPQHPIMPGVLQVEAMKQLCTVLSLDELAPQENEQVYIHILDKVKFRAPNVPGDRLKIEVKQLRFESREAQFDCSVANSAGVSCQAKITLAVRPKENNCVMPELYQPYDHSAQSAMHTEQVQSSLPHRYPFLLVDYVSRCEGNSIMAIKNLTANEEVFDGCQPDFVTLSEPFLCEIIAQAGCICVLGRPENKGKLGYFMTIDHAEFLAPVFPGDQLVCDITVPPAKGRFGKGTGSITVEGKEVLRITLMFAIVDS